MQEIRSPGVSFENLRGGRRSLSDTCYEIPLILDITTKLTCGGSASPLYDEVEAC